MKLYRYRLMSAAVVVFAIALTGCCLAVYDLQDVMSGLKDPPSNAGFE